MSRRSIKLDLIPTNQESMFYDVTLSYDLGGMNYFSGRGEPRGYRVSVTRVKVEDSCRTMMLMAGVAAGLRGHLKDAARYSNKVHEALVTNPVTMELVARLVQKVTAANMDEGGPIPTRAPEINGEPIPGAFAINREEAA